MKKQIKKTTFLIFSALLLCINNVQGQLHKENIDWSILVGFNMGAATPVPIPDEVRAVDHYSPKFNPKIGISGIYNFNDKWGLGLGLSYETKGMRVKDQVKYMYINFVPVGGDSKTDVLEGYFVGRNITDISISYLTLPIVATYKLNDKWLVRSGIYVSNVLKSKFTGSVSDGYLRILTPTGVKQTIDYEEFDFSGDVRDFDFGFTAGANLKLTQRIGVFGNLDWGITPIFYTDFNPMQFKLTNIYGSLGISYAL